MGVGGWCLANPFFSPIIRPPYVILSFPRHEHGVCGCRAGAPLPRGGPPGPVAEPNVGAAAERLHPLGG